MTTHLTDLITAQDAATRNQSLDAFCRAASFAALQDECASLEAFRHTSESLYERVRACFFLYAIHRFHLPSRPELPTHGRIPFDGYLYLLKPA